MQLRSDDVTIFVYNYAVVLTAGYVTAFYGLENRVALLGLGLVLAAFWTVYFRYSIRSRLLPSDETTDGA